jgi:hypothetical protein
MDTGHDRTPEKALRPAWRPAFLAALRENGVVRDACEAAGIGRSTAYDARDADPEFRAGWEAALQEAADLLVREAVRRARVGVREPVIHQGRLCGVWVDADGRVVAEGTVGATMIPLTVTRYSDTLLIFLLKGARPEQYRESAKVVVAGDPAAPIKNEHSGTVRHVHEPDPGAFRSFMAGVLGTGVPPVPEDGGGE